MPDYAEFIIKPLYNTGMLYKTKSKQEVSKMSILKLATIVANSEDACEYCVCKSDEECCNANCVGSIQKQLEQTLAQNNK